ncbi:MAG: DUF1287 domain-containing protein [Polyangiales bacterium]
MKRTALLTLLLASGAQAEDVGIFPELKPTLQPPATLTDVHAIEDRARGNVVLYDGAWPFAIHALGALPPGLVVQDTRVLEPGAELPPGDLDDDGIPDPLDVALGALKTALNADRYDGRYQEIGYPNGDVPREIGVCTDVVIRALRNAGFDLQRAVHDDIALAPEAYPMITRANASIDHRRVKSLLPYFQRHFEAHTTRLDDASDPLRPGDVLFMDTFPDRPGTEHVGMVADTRAPNGLPHVINNWTNGTRTKPMELLSWVPVTHRFRMPSRPISRLATQLLVVKSQGWSSARATLQRYQRRPDEPWRAVGAPIQAVLGHAGSAWGDGAHGQGAPSGRGGPTKREGDGRSPAGVFALGSLRGSSSVRSRLPFAPITDEQVCVDDPRSPAYNTITATGHGEAMRRSDGMYELAIDVLHNRAPVTPAHGSCIFLHVAPAGSRLTGCTGVSLADMRKLAQWLTPQAVLVALPRDEYAALRKTWELP